MMPTTTGWLSWSSGKDSAWTLYTLRQQRQLPVTTLVTTVNAQAQRVAMHAVRESLLDAQAQAVGLPLVKVPIPHPCSNDEYERAMKALIEQAATTGVTHMAFGDLFLEDIRQYRERLLAGTGLAPVFPLWNLNTRDLARRMIANGLRAVVTCVDSRQLPPAFVGRQFDDAFLAELPASVDPCGERGEFHTFAFAGPMFTHPLAVRTGEIVERDGFIFIDLLPVEAA